MCRDSRLDPLPRAHAGTPLPDLQPTGRPVHHTDQPARDALHSRCDQVAGRGAHSARHRGAEEKHYSSMCIVKPESGHLFPCDCISKRRSSVDRNNVMVCMQDFLVAHITQHAAGFRCSMSNEPQCNKESDSNVTFGSQYYCSEKLGRGGAQKIVLIQTKGGSCVSG